MLSWRQYFRQSLLVVAYEHLNKDSERVLRTIAKHAGLPLLKPPDLLSDVDAKKNAYEGHESEDCDTKKRQVPCQLQQRLHGYYHAHNEVLFGIEPALRRWFVPDACCNFR